MENNEQYKGKVKVSKTDTGTRSKFELNVVELKFDSDIQTLFQYYIIPEGREISVNHKLKDKQFKITKLGDKSKYNKSKLVLHGGKRVPNEISQLLDEGVNMKKIGSLKGSNLRKFILELVAENLQKQGWKPTYTNRKAFLETIADSTDTLVLSNEEAIELENGEPNNKGVILLKTMELSLREFNGRLFLAIDRKYKQFTAHTLKDDNKLLYSTGNFYFCCPYFRCIGAVKGDCEYSMQYSRSTLNAIETTNKLSNESYNETGNTVATHYKTKCKEKTWLKDLEAGEAIIKLRGSIYHYPISGLRKAVKSDDVPMILRSKVISKTVVDPDTRYNEFIEFANEIKTIRSCGRNLNITPTHFKEGFLKTPKHRGRNAEASEDIFRSRNFVPLKVSSLHSSFGVLFDSENDISDQYKMKVLSFIEWKKDGKRPYWNFDSKFSVRNCTAVELNSIKELNDSINELKGVLVVSDRKVFRYSVSKICRINKIGFKAMKPTPNFDKKKPNIGLGLYLSSIGHSWKLQKKISRWLGICTQGKILSACIIDENGLIDSSFVWIADSIEKDIIEVANHFNISTVLGGNLYDSILNKITPHVNNPLIRIHDNNSYRIFSKKEDRKLNLPVWMILGDNEALIADRHIMGGDLELDQGTPKPLFLHKISGGAFNKEELEELLTSKHMVPWYDGNHSRYPLPLFAAKRAFDRNPLNYNDLPKLTFDWFNHVWFA